MLREISSKLKKMFCIAPAATVTASTNGTTVDTQGLSAVLFIFNVGVIALGDASNYMSLNIEESDDNSLWSVSSTVKQLKDTSLDAGQLYSGSYTGNKRYTRAAIAETGTASAFISASAVGDLQHQPTS